jgi:hypothetical protein
VEFLRVKGLLNGRTGCSEVSCYKIAAQGQFYGQYSFTVASCLMDI